MKDILIRHAQKEDWISIADIHSSSWKENYRGIYSDYFLDHEVDENRKQIWRERFEKPPQGQIVLVAEFNQSIVGFSCFYLNFKGEAEHYLDNLHVIKTQRHKKVGARLLYESGVIAFQSVPSLPLYLLVYVQNVKAIQFYKRMGSKIGTPYLYKNDDGSTSEIVRCTWPTLSDILT